MSDLTVCASYDRVSTQVQARTGYSLGTQSRTAEEFVAGRPGHVLPDDLRFRDGEDQDASGADWNLPDLTRMLEAAKTHAFSVLLVPAHDRFARNMTKALVLEEQLKKYGVRVVYMNVAVDDSPEGRLLQNQLHSFSEYDREKRKLVSMLNRRAKAQQGRWVGAGTVPFGYRAVREAAAVAGGREGRVLGLAIEESEAAIVRDLFHRAEKASGQKILQWLDASGIEPPGQRRGTRNAATGWGHSTLHTILTNRLYMGEGQYGGHPIRVPSIVTAEQFAATAAAMSRRRHRPSGWAVRKASSEDPYVLRGMLLCGHCTQPGQEQVLRTEAMTSRDRRYYICARKFQSRIDRILPLEERCSLPSLRAELIEDLIWTALVDLLDDHAAARRQLLESQARREEALKRDQDRLAAIEMQAKKARRQLERCVRRLIEIEPDETNEDERAMLEQTRDQANKLLRNLKVERENVDAATRPEGLSAADVALFLQALDDLRASGDLADASPAERRLLFDSLNVRVAVYADEGETNVPIQLKPKRYVRLEAYGDLRLRFDQRILMLRLNLMPRGFEVQVATA